MSIPNVKFSAGALCEKYYDGECGGSGEQFNPDGSLNELKEPCGTCTWRDTPYGKILLESSRSPDLRAGSLVGIHALRGVPVSQEGAPGEASRSGSDPFVEALLSEINLMKDAYRGLNDDFMALRVACGRMGVQLDAAVAELKTLREEVKAGPKKPGPSERSSATSTPEPDPRFGLVDF